MNALWKRIWVVNLGGALGMLDINALDVYYGNVQVLRELSISVNEGEVVAVIGSNGAGKTTLLRTISGLLQPKAGTITFDGTRIDGMAPHLVTKCGIGHVMEGRQIFANLTVRENLLVGAYLHSDKAKIARLVEKAERLFPVLHERRDQLGGTLSGGEQQMLAIGRALMGSPRMLLLDEPSLGLSPLLVEQVAEAIETIRDEEGTPMLLVEQNARLALALSQRGYVIETGEVVLNGESEFLRENDLVKRAYLGF
jgi:branched-chain amino acid transport system ATP-binding protein